MELPCWVITFHKTIFFISVPYLYLISELHSNGSRIAFTSYVCDSSVPSLPNVGN